MRMVLILTLGLALTGCDKLPGQAKTIVAAELGGPAVIDFRNLRTQRQKGIVCGEVMASDRPGAGWRPFVAYPSLGRAAVSPTAEIGAEAEMGNPLLKGAAAEFIHACD